MSKVAAVLCALVSLAKAEASNSLRLSPQPLTTTSERKVSFWYAPGSYGGGDINVRFSKSWWCFVVVFCLYHVVHGLISRSLQYLWLSQNTLAVLAANPGVVTNVFLYCGHEVVSGGLTVDPSLEKLCLETNLIAGLVDLNIAPEIVINSGNNDVKDYRNFFANETANLAAVVAEAARFGTKGVSFDLEPQVGLSICLLEYFWALALVQESSSCFLWVLLFCFQTGNPASTAQDAVGYANFLGKLRPKLAETDVRLTIAVAQWSPMLSQYVSCSVEVHA